MTRRRIKAAGALVLAGMLCAASAALADHDDHHEHGHGHHRYEHHGNWHRHDYDHGYVRYYGSGPGYYGPQVYVPAPPPPSFGLNLVFPIH